MQVTARIRRSVKEARNFGRWLFREFPKAPGLEMYARRQHKLNVVYTSQIRARARALKSGQITPFVPGELPKVVWIYWAQGEDAAPYIVRRCIESWRERNPGWEVRVLDATTVSGFADISDVPKFLPKRYHANMLRLRLLQRFGGVWADATVLCHRPLDDWLPLHMSGDFFVFSNPGPDRFVSSWFIASPKDGFLVSLWQEAYSRYVTSRKILPRKYFMVMYNFQYAVLSDPEATEKWNNCAKLPARSALQLMFALRTNSPPDAAFHAIKAGLPVSKLSWKIGVSDADFDDILRRLEAL